MDGNLFLGRGRSSLVAFGRQAALSAEAEFSQKKLQEKAAVINMYEILPVAALSVCTAICHVSRSVVCQADEADEIARDQVVVCGAKLFVTGVRVTTDILIFAIRASNCWPGVKANGGLNGIYEAAVGDIDSAGFPRWRWHCV